MSSWRDRRTEAWLAAGVLAVVVYFLVPHGTTQSVVYDVVAVGSALAIAWSVAVNRPAVPVAWLLFAAGNLAFAVADIIFNVLVNPPTPSVADVFYIGGYPLLFAGLVLLLFASGGHRRAAALGDATILTFAFVLVQWVFVLDPIVDASGSALERGVNAAYPLADIILLAGLAGFFVSAAWRTPSFVLLVASVVVLLGADEIYGISPDSYRSGDWIDAAWLLSYLLWAAAALHPSMCDLSQPTRKARSRLRVSSGRIGLLTAALLAAPAVLVIQDTRGVDVNRVRRHIGA